MFCGQNFIFFLNPSQFFFFLGLFNMPHQREYIFGNLIYTKNIISERSIISSDNMVLLTYVFVFAIIIISLILIFNKKLLIQEKFGFFFLSNIFLGVYSIQHYLYLLLFAFVVLLFIPFYEKNIKGFEWVKRNKFFIIGILSITLILNPNLHILFSNFAVALLLGSMMICLIYLYNNKKNFYKLPESVKTNQEIKLNP